MSESVAYCMDCEEIAVWKSAAEIERVLGFGHSQISRACKNRSPYNGYSWCFYD